MSSEKSFESLLLESYQRALERSIDMMLSSIEASLAKQGVKDSDMVGMLGSLWEAHIKAKAEV